MKSSIALSCLLALGACTSSENTRRPAASVKSEAHYSGGEKVNAEGVSAERAEAREARAEAREKRAEARDERVEPAARDDAERARERVRAETDSREPTNRVVADGPTAVAPAGKHSADNTGVNQRDVERNAITPLDQRENATDLEVTQKIRQAVVGDDSLSFTAKNVKIITQEGRVSLRGPVKSSAERAAIAAHASKFAGAARVDNQLEIAK